MSCGALCVRSWEEIVMKIVDGAVRLVGVWSSRFYQRMDLYEVRIGNGALFDGHGLGLEAPSSSYDALRFSLFLYDPQAA